MTMTVTDVTTDYDDLTLTVVVDLDAPVDQVWELWADPRQLEKWWGPPTYPATVEEHDLTPGGTVTYFMTGPEGQPHGYWRITAVDAPTSLEFVDGFAHDDGKPNDDLPTTTMTVQLSERGNGTRMELRSTFDSREQMEQMAEMGMVEGIQEAIGQMDALVAA
jgi:uncharacterized protein YndB with AHSA1/START domain